MSSQSVDKPILIIPGAQKAGTSSLLFKLASHEDIGAIDIEEPQFFALDTGTVSNNLLWYAARFPDDEGVLLDRSTFYLHSHRAPEHIAEFCADPYAVILVRDPARRAYSSYMHMYKKIPQRERRTFERIVDEVSRYSEGKDLRSAERHSLEAAASRGDIDADYLGEDYLSRRLGATFPSHFESPLLPYSYFGQSLYSDAIRRWKEVLGRHRVSVVFFEEMINNPGQTITDILGWLGLSVNIDDLSLPHGNPTQIPRSRASRMIVGAVQRMASTDVIAAISRRAGARDVWERLRGLFYRRPDGPEARCYRRSRDLLSKEYDKWTKAYPVKYSNYWSPSGGSER